MTAAHRGGGDDTAMKISVIGITLLGLMAGPLAGQEATPDVAAAEARVNEALRASDVAPAGKVTVARHASSLVLSGEVDSQVERAQIEKVAGEAAKGVRITSHIEVRETATEGSTPAAPAVETTRHIEQALRSDPRTANLGVAVSMDEERVIGLHGLVPTAANRWEAELVARGAAGSFRVRNHLQLPAAP